MQNYKKFWVTISGFDKHAIENSTAIPCDTISEGVEKFLQNYLKNNKIKVIIEEHNTTVTKH